MERDRLEQFAEWAAHSRSNVVVPMLRAVSRSAKMGNEEKKGYMRATADMLGVDNLPDAITGLNNNSTPLLKKRRIVDDESDSEDDAVVVVEQDSEDERDTAEGFGVEITELQKGCYYSMPTKTTGNKTETSYFRADSGNEITWLYTHAQLSSVFNQDDIPLQAGGNELYISDHCENNFVVPAGVAVKRVSVLRERHGSQPYIRGACKTAPPACILAFPQGQEAKGQRLRDQANDYIRVLLSRGGFPSRDLERAVRATKTFSPSAWNTSRAMRCSACGMRRQISHTVDLGTPPSTFKLGSYCFERVKLAWQMANTKNENILAGLCRKFREELV